MKNIYLLCSLLLFGAACTKKNEVPGTASLNLFNGVIGSAEMLPNFRGTTPLEWYRNVGFLTYGLVRKYTSVSVKSYDAYYNYSGVIPLAFSEYPDTTAHDQPIFNLTLDLPVGSMNTLFLTGSLTEPDTLMSRDYPPYHAVSDSTMGVRFVNLSPGGLQVSINLQGESNGSEVNNLAYKSITSFKNYSANTIAGDSPYVFEIRDASNGNLLTTHTIDVKNVLDGQILRNNYRFRNLTLIIIGVPGNASPYQLKTALMNN